METLRTAVIGTGQMGRHHARIYSELCQSELVGIADIDMERARALADKYGTKAYRDYRDMLEKEKPDAVSVAVPTKLHSLVGERVLEHSNLLVEKPIADSEENARKLIETAKNNEKKLMVGQIERFNPVISYFKEWVRNNECRYMAFNIVRIGLPNPRAGITSGVILDLGIHDIDMVRYLTGEEVLNIDARALSFFESTKFEDHAQIWLKMKDVSASIVTNWTSPVKVREMYVTLDKAFVRINYLTQSMEVSMKDNGDLDRRLIGYPKKEINLKYVEPLRREIEEFLRSIDEDRKPAVSGEDALNSLRIALSAEKIARSS